MMLCECEIVPDPVTVGSVPVNVIPDDIDTLWVFQLVDDETSVLLDQFEEK